MISELIKTNRRVARLEEQRQTEAPGIGAAWIPELWQAGISIPITVDFAVYTTIGDLVFVSTRFTASANSGVGLVEIRNLPHASAYSSIGGEMVAFVGGVNRVGSVRHTAGSSSCVMTIDNNSGDFGNTPSVAFVIGNGVRMSSIYFRQQ